MSYCASVIAAAPKRRKSGTQGRKFFPQNSTGKSFQAIHDFSYPPTRIELNKKMHVIGHNFQGMNCHLKLAGFLAEKRLKPPIHLISKHTATVLRAPHNMQLEATYGSGILSVTAHKSIIHLPDKYHNYDLGVRAAIPLPAEAGSPLAA
jgi:hypothetical protein